MSYRGRATTVGNSRAIALEAALFRAHPEFGEGEFRVDALGSGVLVVRPAGDRASDSPPDDDPVLAAFLSFIEQDMEEHPEGIRPLSPDLLSRAEALTEGVEVDLDDDGNTGAE
jgi:antitoxin PrlF